MLTQAQTQAQAILCLLLLHVMQVVSERVDKPRNIEFKGATDLVTDTDKASEDAVLSVRHGLHVKETAIAHVSAQRCMPVLNSKGQKCKDLHISNCSECYASETCYQTGYLNGTMRTRKYNAQTCAPRHPTVPASCTRELRAAFPDHALLGEEGGVSGDTSSSYLWCVDPLDGTTNFAHGYPSFAVSVAGAQMCCYSLDCCQVSLRGHLG
jgi:hypothetical protein